MRLPNDDPGIVLKDFTLLSNDNLAPWIDVNCQGRLTWHEDVIIVGPNRIENCLAWEYNRRNSGDELRSRVPALARLLRWLAPRIGSHCQAA